MKNIRKIIFILVISLLSIFSLAFRNTGVFAEDHEESEDRYEERDSRHEEDRDEDRREKEEEEEDDYDHYEKEEESYQAPADDQTISDEGETTKTETILVPVTPKTLYRTVVEAGYNIDSDRDNLVDAIDPDPDVPQQQYFTDSDEDTVSDAVDAHPGQDDFLYTDDLDANHNGILDSYE